MSSNIVIIGSIEASLGFPNTWTALQTFKAGVVATTVQAELNQSTLNGIPFSSSTPTSGQVLGYNGASWVPVSLTTGVSSVSNSDGTLTISPTTGAVVASLNLAHANTWSATQTFSEIAPNATQSTLSGTTAGSITYNMPFIGASYKKFIAYANGYENDTTTNQTITFPTAFTYAPGIVYNNTGLTISASTTTLTITAPNSTTLFTGWIIIEGW